MNESVRTPGTSEDAITMRPRLLALLLASPLMGLAASAAAVTIDWVTVGDAGNPADEPEQCLSVSCGSVSYDYYISKFEVTNAEYAEFLNAKAALDPLGLYNEDQASNVHGGITRSGDAGDYTYAVKVGFADKPVNFVSFYDALRFINWLHNGQGDGDTEAGAYTLLGGTDVPSNGMTVTRNAGARVFLPTENEWYKAAYYDAAFGVYYLYPTGSNRAPRASLPTTTRNRANFADKVGTVTDVGAYAGSASPYGTFDQGGNLWEWNEPSRAPSRRMLRGGDWGVVALGLSAGAFVDFGAEFEQSNAGFRVASPVPEPAKGILTITGLLSLSLWRRRA